MQRAIRFEAVNVCSSSSTHRSISRPLFTWSNKYDMTSIEYFTHIGFSLFNHHMMRCAFLMMVHFNFFFSFCFFILLNFILSISTFFILYLSATLYIYFISITTNSSFFIINLHSFHHSSSIFFKINYTFSLLLLYNNKVYNNKVKYV